MDKKPARFDNFLEKAESLVQSPERVQKLTAQAMRKLTQQGSDGLRQAQSQLQTSISMINAWRTGEYDGISTKTIVSLAAALLYFVVPLDVIPDFILGWGFIDDMAVMGYVYNQVSHEIDDFKTWQAGKDEAEEETEDASSENHPPTQTPD